MPSAYIEGSRALHQVICGSQYECIRMTNEAWTREVWPCGWKPVGS